MTQKCGILYIRTQIINAKCSYIIPQTFPISRKIATIIVYVKTLYLNQKGGVQTLVYTSGKIISSK